MSASLRDDRRHCRLLRHGWLLDARMRPVVIGLLALTPLATLALPSGEHMQIWSAGLFGMQMFGLGLYAAQFAPIWTRTSAGEPLRAVAEHHDN